MTDLPPRWGFDVRYRSITIHLKISIALVIHSLDPTIQMYIVELVYLLI